MESHAGNDMSVDLKAPWSGASAWASINGNGDLELELFDYSDEAASSLGGDVAWIWTVEKKEISRITNLLGVCGKTAMLNAFAERFANVHAVRDWLKAQGIPVHEKFDSQA